MWVVDLGTILSLAASSYLLYLTALLIIEAIEDAIRPGNRFEGMNQEQLWEEMKTASEGKECRQISRELKKYNRRGGLPAHRCYPRLPYIIGGIVGVISYIIAVHTLLAPIVSLLR